MVKLVFGVLVCFSLVSCAITEFPSDHTNPLDPIYDSGSFRLGLTFKNAAEGVKLEWGAVYYKDGDGDTKELSSDDIKIAGNAQLLFKSSAPSEADITAVKNAGTLSGYTVKYNLSEVKPSTTTVTGTYQGYYIICLDYKYDGKTGRLYSNFVVVP
ncbi:MAG: hypothetical protein LDLANPLL_00724 [Turneriella sp.]|nr:hypothetical protein [Turneriella sp.]